MNPEQLLARIKSLTAALTPTQLLSLGLAFVLVVGLVGGSAYWLNSSSYHLLFSDLDPEAAAEVVTRLRTQKVPYRLDEGGRAIRVPASRVDELRLDFSSQGLPSSGRIGFEIFDRTAFGATEFLEQVNYRRALEGELARTISTLSEVAGARVHIAMEKTSLFESRQQPAKASVVLKLRGSRSLASSAAKGIASLLAASIEGLRPESVVILDSFGQSLMAPVEDTGQPLGGMPLERRRRIEQDMSTRVVRLLEPVVGAGRVRVNVSTQFDPASEEETEERWDPATVVRSRQVTTDGGALAFSQGLAGARANLPEPVPPAQPTGDGTSEGAATEAATPAPAVINPAPPAPTRGSEVTNYEVSKVVRHTVRPSGDLVRLSVAVIVDNALIATENEDGTVGRRSEPRAPEELQKIHGLVAAAVGFDSSRGDLLTVENIAFDEPVIEEPEPPSFLQRYGPQLMDVGRIAAVLLLGLMGYLFVVRPVVRQVGSLPAGQVAGMLPQQLPRTVEELEGDIEAQLDAAPGDVRKTPALIKRLTTMTQAEPDNAARLLRSWLLEENR